MVRWRHFNKKGELSHHESELVAWWVVKLTIVLIHGSGLGGVVARLQWQLVYQLRYLSSNYLLSTIKWSLSNHPVL